MADVFLKERQVEYLYPLQRFLLNHLMPCYKWTDGILRKCSQMPAAFLSVPYLHNPQHARLEFLSSLIRPDCCLAIHHKAVWLHIFLLRYHHLQFPLLQYQLKGFFLDADVLLIRCPLQEPA